MSIENLVSKLNRLQVVLGEVKGQLSIDAPKGVLTPDLIDELKENKQDLLRFFRNEKKRTPYTSLKPVEKREYYGLSSAQKRLYVLQQMDPATIVYNMTEIYPFKNNIDKNRLEETFKKLIQRHESLRTSFTWSSDQTVQRIHDGVEFEIEGTGELSPLSISGRGSQPAAAPVNSFIKPFDLAKAPLMRIGRIITADRSSMLIVDVHHIISDAVSHEIFKKDFFALFAGEELPPLKLQYKDFSEWQTSPGHRELIKSQQEYWVNRFSPLPPVLQLPTDYKRPVIQSFEGAFVNFWLDEKETRLLKQMAVENDVTVFMSLIADINILLAKLSWQEDIVIGITPAGRRHADLHNIMGMFINTLAIRNFPSGNKTIKEFLKEVKETALKAYDNQDYQFEELVDDISLPRDTSRNPLFDVMFNLQDQTEYKKGISTNHSKTYEHTERKAKFDINLQAVDLGQQFFFYLEYSTRLFKKETIEHMIDNFKKIISNAALNPQSKISAIETITVARRKELIDRFNEELHEELIPGTLQEQLAESSRAHARRVAIQYGAKQVSYSLLDVRSTHIANFIIAAHIKKGTLIGIYLSSMVEIICVMAGILKAGCIFVPLDTLLPGKRLESMIRVMDTGIIFTDGSNKERLSRTVAAPMKERIKTIILDDCFHGVLLSPPAPLKNNIVYGSQDPVYIYFTSGSTGTPEAIVGKNESLLQFIRWEIDTFNLDASSRVSQFSALGFDAFLRDVFTPLAVGGTVCVPENREFFTNRDNAVLQWIDKHKISLIHCVPAIFYLLNHLNLTAENFKYLKYVLISGDRINPHLLKNWHEKFKERIQLVNFYGPTETTLIKTCYFIRHRDLQELKIPIGKPIRGSSLILLDREMNVCDRGDVGEIYIRSPYLSLGYWNNDKLNRERFLPNPFNDDPTDVIYKTGDLARELPDGNFEFIGRKDRQVKIRGARVELAEIENALSKHKNINAAAAIARTDENQGNYLCAYYVADAEFPVTELKKSLSNDLPGFMIPDYLVRIEQMPLSHNGKLDIHALPDPRKMITKKDSNRGPGNEIEKKIFHIWSEILSIDVEKIGMQDNFFELGGNSLNILAMLNQINKAFDLQISLSTFLLHPSIEDLSANITRESLFNRLQCIVKLNYSTSGKNIFIIHQMEGMILPYKKLAHFLEKECNVYGIQPGDFSTHHRPSTLRKKILEDYIREIRMIQKSGPYTIIGYCVGNRIAYELTSMLEDMGEQVERLILLNPSVFIPHYFTKFLELKERIYQTMKYNPNHPKKKKKNLESPGNSGIGPGTNAGDTEAEIERQREIIGRQMRKMFLDYRPRRIIAAPISVILANDSQSLNYPARRWAAITKKELKIFQTRGTHNSMLMLPYVKTLANLTRKIIKLDTKS